MSEGSEGYRRASVKRCGYTSWPQTRETLPRRANWLVSMAPRPHQDDARTQPVACHPDKSVAACLKRAGRRHRRHLTETNQRCLGYPKAIPGAAGHCSSMDMKSPISRHHEYRFYQGLVATCVANGIQAANFLGDRFLRKTHRSPSEIDELFMDSMNSAFSATESFLVTGAPHASAYYPRDFAWFYPDVLDPDTIMDFEDAIRRVRLLERSVRLMLEAVRAGVVTTTIIPAGRLRDVGVN